MYGIEIRNFCNIERVSFYIVQSNIFPVIPLGPYNNKLFSTLWPILKKANEYELRFNRDW